MSTLKLVKGNATGAGELRPVMAVGTPETGRMVGHLDLRVLTRLHCARCDRRWVAPTKGACPQCFTDQTVSVEGVDRENAVRV